MCLVVTLCVIVVTVVLDGEEVLVGAALVALVVTPEELAEIWIKCKESAVYHLVGIHHSLLQTGIGLAELWVCLCVGYILHLGIR